MKAWQVDCEHERVYRMLVELAREKKWRGSVLDSPKNCRWLYAQQDGFLNGYEVEQVTIDTTDSVSLDEVIARLEIGPPEPEIYIEIKDGHQLVEFPGDGSAKIGCVTVPVEAMRKLARTLKAGGVNFGGHHLYYHVTDDGILTHIEWNGHKVPIDTVHKILAKVGITAEAPEPAIYREFVEALAEDELETWAKGHNWPGLYKGEFKGASQITYCRGIAAKVLEKATAQGATEGR